MRSQPFERYREWRYGSRSQAVHERMTLSTSDLRPFALVVDDDAVIRMDVSDILEEAGFRTFEAPGPVRALAILREHHASIRLLFTDVEMPGPMDGFGLARAAAESWPHLGILVASGARKPGPSDLPDGAHFVGKPFSAQIVHARFKKLLPNGQRPEPLKE